MNNDSTLIIAAVLLCSIAIINPALVVMLMLATIIGLIISAATNDIIGFITGASLFAYFSYTVLTMTPITR